MNRNATFSQRVVIVTGASSGIGRATAEAFAREGAITILASRSKAALDRAAEPIRSLNPLVRVIPTDVASAQQVESMVATVEREFGRIDVLINNAGIAAVGPVEGDRFVEEARELFATSFFGKVHAVRAVLPIMRRQGQGHIVNVSSVAGRKAFANFGAYSAAMHAIAGVSDALRQELRGSGIGVSTILPSLAKTGLFAGVELDHLPAPFREMKPMSPDAVARAILRAVRKQQPRVVLPWQPNALLWADALSVRLGDLVARLLSSPPFLALIGLYRGRERACEAAARRPDGGDLKACATRKAGGSR